MGVKKVWPSNKPFWILWGPESSKPSRVQFQSQEQAERVAKEMSVKYDAAFVVMKSIKRVEPPPVEKYKITEYSD